MFREACSRFGEGSNTLGEVCKLIEEARKPLKEMGINLRGRMQSVGGNE
jgi:hypothetical protein